jgi:hypothetical protein
MTVTSESVTSTRAKDTSSAVPMKSPGRVIGRKKSRASGPRARELVRVRP